MQVELDNEIIRCALRPVRGDWTDIVVPGEIEAQPDCRYLPEYAWMDAFEKVLKKRIELAMGRPLRPWQKKIFGSDGALSEALSNAFVHGNRRHEARPIEVRTQVSRKGVGFSICDQGKGFDVQAFLEQAREKKDGYFHHAGNGLQCLIGCPSLSFAYSEGGSRLFLLILFTI